MSGRFDPVADNLPATLPIFPLTGVLLLPRGKLPLNIFEPRYLAMVSDALAEHRIIGMIQPAEETPADNFGKGPSGQPGIYSTGCAGRIVSFNETEDGRYLITLCGLCRFDVVREIPLNRGYRRVVPDFKPYLADLEPEQVCGIDRPRLLGALKAYFALHDISVDWSTVEKTGNEKLVTSLAMICPFAPSEKQALLQAASLADRCKVMTGLMESAVGQCRGGDKPSLH
jgi:Lon protease-like protein